MCRRADSFALVRIQLRIVRTQRRATLTFEHVESERAHSNADHVLRMIEELHSACVQRKRLRLFVEEKMHSVGVEIERECLQERNEVSDHLFVLKVKRK